MYLVYNQDRFKQEFCTFVNQKNTLIKSEDLSFHDEIKTQFEEYVRRVLVDNITGHLAISTEDAMMVVENLNLDVYLEVK